MVIIHIGSLGSVRGKTGMPYEACGYISFGKFVQIPRRILVS